MLFQGEIPKNGLVITDGIVRSYTISSSGDEQTIAFHAEGDLLPFSWLMGTTPNTLFYYEAATKVHVLQFSKDDFDEKILTDQNATSSLLDLMGRDFTSLMLRINGLEQPRAEEKIAFTLYYLLFRFGTEVDDGLWHIDLKLRHNTLASLVGLTRESTTKVLRQFDKKSIVRYSSGVYVVNKELLEKYTGEDVLQEIELGAE